MLSFCSIDEALDLDRVRETLASFSGLSLAEPADGSRIGGGKVYLCAPDTITTVQDGAFSVRPAEQAPGERGTIDTFLVSLAESRAEEAVGVLLAGTNGDGTLGVASLKDEGGLAIAERAPGEEDLAASNTPAALADLVLPADEIARQVLLHILHLRRLEERKGFDQQLAEAAGSLTRIADILRNKTGNDFHGYKQNTFLRRIQRRMHVVQKEEIESYVEFLQNDAHEVSNLFNDLLIGVTQFFRDKREFEILETEVIPKIVRGERGGPATSGVWVLGCATGEEAYSIGILLRERMATMESVPQVQIFATDLDGRSLAAARVGRYRTNIEADLTPERLARWFVREGDTYCVIRELREMCIFSQHNVIKDAPFSRLDLVSCRNLLIYLNADLQNRVIPLFHFGLLPDRYLFLGNSENVTRHPKLFVSVDRRARIFKRLESGTRLPPEFPLTPFARSAGAVVAPQPSSPDLGLERRADAWRSATRPPTSSRMSSFRCCTSRDGLAVSWSHRRVSRHWTS
ncbi:hypothetical protein JNW90_26515 [Micromonospora sp. STR1s_5]|nr:hypothetical protein [Micromonospora sp. STR1s_5]